MSAASTFGDLLCQLRRRAGLTQDELAIAVGFSKGQISRLEKNQRLPNVDLIATLFVAALGLQEEPQLALRLVELAAVARGEKPLTVLPIKREVRPMVREEVLSEVTSRVPWPPTALVGRAYELDLITKRVLGHYGRLFTLFGPPGVGKTRLALTVAAQLQPFYADGAHFVPLAALDDPQLLAPTLLAALSVQGGHKPPQTQLLEFLRHKELLLVLDNFEQLLTATPLVSTILAECPGVHLLITSRTTLRLRGEQRFPITPLSLTPALELFAQRAQEIDPTFAITEQNQAVLRAICQQLDCLPLAIELSAAQIDLYEPQALLTQIQTHRLDLLTDGPSDLPAHQQTLRNAIQRSYALLTSEEQRCFRRLGVFIGGFDLAAAQAVGVSAPMLQHLLQKSLLYRTHTHPTLAEGSHFLMLETIRELAVEQLALHGEQEHAYDQHLHYFLSLTETANRFLFSDEHLRWLGQLQHIYGNLREVLRRALQPEVTPLVAPTLAGLRLCNELYRFWTWRSTFTEGYDWCKLALERLAALPIEQQPVALQARLLFNIGTYAAYLQRGDEATALVQQALTRFRKLADPIGTGDCLLALGIYAFDRHEPDAAQELLLEAQRLYTEQAHSYGLYYANNVLGEMQRYNGDYLAAQRCYQQALQMAERANYRRGTAIVLINLAFTVNALGAVEQAVATAQRSLQIFVALDDRHNIATCLTALGCIFSQSASPAVQTAAARLFGASNQLLVELNSSLETADQAEKERYLAHCRQCLGVADFAASYEHGRRLTLAEVLAIVTQWQ